MVAHACHSSPFQLRQKDHCKFEVNLDYVMSSKLAWAN